MRNRERFEKQLSYIAWLLKNDHIKSFKEIFIHIERKEFSRRAGLPYRNFLKKIRSPSSMTFKDTYSIAKTLKTALASFIEFLENDVSGSEGPVEAR
jgi:hypothetical protein